MVFASYYIVFLIYTDCTAGHITGPTASALYSHTSHGNNGNQGNIITGIYGNILQESKH
jgi:hypothetical protein